MKRAGIAAITLFALACSDLPFPNKSIVKEVRILAIKADLPYAHPGETVNLEALYWDGRVAPTAPLHFYWFPTPCINPPGGEYFDCYPELEAQYPDLHVDYSAQLLESARHSVAIPATALDAVPPTPGATGETLVTAWSFMIACAGHVERRQRTVNYAENESPIGCFGPDGIELPIEQGTFGFTRITISSTERNQNPSIKDVVFRGKALDLTTGLSVIRCRKDFIDTFTRGNCDTFGMGVAYDDSDAEIDPSNVDANGHPGRETIYTDWYVTLGRFPQPRNIERDPFVGRPEQENNLYEPPRDPGHGTMWVVLHDNRGGTDWRALPVEIR